MPDQDIDAFAKAPTRPAYASGSLNLEIPPLSRTLKVTVQPAATALEPGAQTTMTVTLTDASGKPLLFKPGNTWIQLVPGDLEVTVEN